MENEQDNLIDAIKNAASGYGAVVLGVACFILSLGVVMAIVRFVVGASSGA